jgi:phosphoribosylformylglycinamidine (FGAM) synthase-like enzyme
VLFLVGDTAEELGCSEWAAARGAPGGDVPRCRPADFFRSYRAVAALVSDGLLSAAHAPGRGGLLPSLFLLARASGLGLGVDLSRAPRLGHPGWEALLLGESAGRLLVAARPDRSAEVERRLAGVPSARLGTFDGSGRLRVTLGLKVLLDASVGELAASWKREA